MKQLLATFTISIVASVTSILMTNYSLQKQCIERQEIKLLNKKFDCKIKD